MKRILLGLTLLAGTMSANLQLQAQSLKTELPQTLQRRQDQSVYFEKTYTVEQSEKAMRYKRVKQWATSNFQPGDATITFDEQENNYINITTNMPLAGLPGASSSYKLAIRFNDGKVRLECPSFTYNKASQGAISRHELGTISLGSANEGIYQAFDQVFAALLTSFETALFQQAENE